MAASEKVVKFRDFKKPAKVGKHHRLLVMNGDQKGEGFLLKSARVVVGRGDKADIKINDLKSSREHAEFSRVADNYIVTDLGSQNGVYVNDLKITQHTLKDGDSVIIGKTIFKFNSFEIKEKKLESEEKVDRRSKDPEQNTENQAAKRKKLLIGVAVMLLVMLFLGEEDPTQGSQRSVSSRRVKNISEDFIEAARKRELQEDRELKEKLGIIFSRGLRESREGNYFRAISEFNLALILSPGNARAKYYLEKTKKILNDQIEMNFKKARRDFAALKYSNAQVSYCSIIRLLRDYPDDERYKAAEKNINVIEEKLGLEQGEISCF